eukprot:CAMPEP_0185529150 /NCGR_PEP_ID=MMETSP1366-20130426/100630_1 /TAXON_ID=38817 /ORGANISM="Gephyrocapsa oceanica, Strain RCC1303" /LENGTH=106 /DNA_ID=CAMNT_0028140751 /DNA_START=21 /DNA_END=339 /DNA_ORIENTATION=+
MSGVLASGSVAAAPFCGPTSAALETPTRPRVAACGRSVSAAPLSGAALARQRPTHTAVAASSRRWLPHQPTAAGQLPHLFSPGEDLRDCCRRGAAQESAAYAGQRL